MVSRATRIKILSDMNNKTIQILLTNDDSIHSPGLWAAAEALDSLGYVHVVAPRDQQTSAGRSIQYKTGATGHWPVSI